MSFANFVDHDFVSQVWDKKPARTALPNGQALCNEDTLVTALKRYSTIPTRLKETNPLAEFVTGINCQATPAPVASFAIRDGEADLDTYLSRVESQNSSNEWSIAYFGLHGASSEVWDSAKIFIKKLSTELGYRPGGRVDVDCFIGRYSSTPSGVHVDDAHNFGFTLRPGKKMYTWEAKHEHVKWLKSPAYDQYKNDSIPLANDPGFVCYFPHDALHVGETKERASVNVNISFWKESEPGQATRQFLFARTSDEKLTRNDLLTNGDIALSAQKLSDLNQTRAAIADGSLETYLAMNDLLEQTTLGLKVPRPVFATEAPDLTKPLTLKNSASIHWYDSVTLEQLLIGVNGHCISCPKDPDIVAFLKKLTMGSPVLLDDQHGDLRTLAEQFHVWGALNEN